MTGAMRTLKLSDLVDTDYLSWLPDALGKPLLHDLQELYGQDLSGIPWDGDVHELFGRGHEAGRFNTYVTDGLMLLHKSRNAFHNMEHGQRVGCNCEDALDLLQVLFGAFPQELAQITLWAYAMHDFLHCGAAFFALKQGKLPRGAHPGMTLEVFTAHKFDVVLKKSHFYQYSPLARLVANYIVVSSAFGAANPDHGERLRLHLVKPRAILGTLMRIGDVLPSSDFVSQVKAEADLLYGEIPATPVAPTWRGYAGSRAGFLSYVDFSLNAFDSAVAAALPPQRIPYRITDELGWRNLLEHARKELQRAQRGGFRMAVLRSTIGTHGDPLA
jgi:hypothetical protein